MSFRAWRSHFLSASCVALSALIALWNVIASFVIDRGWHPAGDPALDELLVRDVWTHHFPRVGSYSRFGWNHPGAWFHYLASIPYEVSGGGSWTLKLTAAIVAAAALGACARAGWKIGEKSAVGAHAGAAVASLSWLLSAAGPFGVTFRFAWNVDIAQMLFLAFVWWSAALLVGVVGAGGAVVLLGTLLVQLYLGYLPLVGTIAALAGVAVAIRRTHRPRLPGARLRPAARPAIFCLGLAAAMWAPIVLDQLAGRRNLSAIGAYFRTDSQASLTKPSDALQMLFQQLDGRWLFNTHLLPGGWTVPWVALVACALWVVVRANAFGGLVRSGAMSLVAAAFTIVLARNQLFAYRLLWLPVIGTFWCAVLVWGLIEILTREWPDLAKNPRVQLASGAVVLLIGLEAAAGFTTQDSGQFASREQDSRTVMAEVSMRVPDVRVAVGRSRSGGAHDLLAGLRVAAEHANQNWCDPINEPWLAGEHRLCGRTRPNTGLFVVGPGERAPASARGIQILDSPKGRVYLMPTASLVAIARATDASKE